ncbi:hypothetical protein SCALM49S_07798 [Streptomyces californicus]
MPAETPLLRLAGAGLAFGCMVRACTDAETFWRVVRDGVSCLSPYAHPELPSASPERSRAGIGAGASRCPSGRSAAPRAPG